MIPYLAHNIIIALTMPEPNDLISYGQTDYENERVDIIIYKWMISTTHSMILLILNNASVCIHMCN